MIENLKEITKDTLLSEVQKFADAKARFVVTVCNDLGDKLEATYYFNYSPGVEMVALRMVVGKDEEVPSISGIYLCAVLAENEMFEQYGLKVKDIAIDFGGLMLLGNGSPVTPMLKDKAAGGKGGE
ncbi:NADH-quinone oxidoreductase subunit C [Syntrophaceticus schinkii]|jgi:ech hydrogenase subunit D|uniref:Ech Hydrogenase subunit D n=1 Tax=Syntrophaceticus schinkii TaxID=499207 RepID=A0A0B7MCN2_9FIRM|nr:NADH-quinone oxidoreductase subunit C [Syntrophaceticus schinkii]MDD2360011.1 NADH-quinone oxidoreductase subunit C [Syntrophaceticus schinkii]MDD4260929.1 NADH-quinone oxidoreductase subunit C [Syntrophaceticus schinkii]MDD4675187.1 NADH-quinone oxidoreductase subunit C [Syntrophaceticus schinkii]CEO88289.1 ech Hydrogenase subunit D [Syntrophaceticus schinkii]